jgi:hypothetical protein
MRGCVDSELKEEKGKRQKKGEYGRGHKGEIKLIEVVDLRYKNCEVKLSRNKPWRPTDL